MSVKLLISADKCPSCGKYDFWHTGYDYDTYEWISFCNSCNYEERRFDKEGKETFEFLEKAIKEGKVKGVFLPNKVRRRQ